MNKPKSDSTLNTEGWKTINWRQVERYGFKLQKRIYAASRCGDIQRVRKLQKTLMRFWSNRALAVRRVTQDNQGKKTAGVDGIKSLSPGARFNLAKGLFINGKSKPTWRIWIPKPGKTEFRPLSIPTIFDRALQAVVKATLELFGQVNKSLNWFLQHLFTKCPILPLSRLDPILSLVTEIAISTRFTVTAQ